MRTYKGTIHQGSKRATQLGFPTVNIPLDDEKVSGVYAARVFTRDGEYIAAVFADTKRKLLEAHILSFGGRDLYEESVTIELHEKLRDSKEFTDDETLKKAIADDISSVRKYFEKLV